MTENDNSKSEWQLNTVIKQTLWNTNETEREEAGEQLISNGDWAGVNWNPLLVPLKAFYWIAYWEREKTDELLQQLQLVKRGRGLSYGVNQVK